MQRQNNNLNKKYNQKNMVKEIIDRIYKEKELIPELEMLYEKMVSEYPGPRFIRKVKQQSGSQFRVDKSLKSRKLKFDKNKKFILKQTEVIKSSERLWELYLLKKDHIEPNEKILILAPNPVIDLEGSTSDDILEGVRRERLNSFKKNKININ